MKLNKFTKEGDGNMKRVFLSPLFFLVVMAIIIKMIIEIMNQGTSIKFYFFVTKNTFVFI